MAESTVGPQGATRQECVRKCARTARTGRFKRAKPVRGSGMNPQVRTYSDLFRHEADTAQAAYGSEGWGFESLRARSVLRLTLNALEMSGGFGFS